MKQLSKLGKKAIINSYSDLYQMINHGIVKKWDTNRNLTTADLDRVFDAILEDTYNDNFFVKNFVFDFTCYKWEDLLED